LLCSTTTPHNNPCILSVELMSEQNNDPYMMTQEEDATTQQHHPPTTRVGGGPEGWFTLILHSHTVTRRRYA